MESAVIGSDLDRGESKAGFDPALRPNIESIVIEDDEPVDNFFQDAQRRLLVNALYSSWAGSGEDRPWLCGSDIGIFTDGDEPTVVPDVMVSIDVAKDVDLDRKVTLSYFVWQRGKWPDVCVEIVSNNRGSEDEKKLRAYERMHIPYYVIFDPSHFLGDEVLRVYQLNGSAYARHESGMMPEMNLGVRLWQGGFENIEGVWLRWTDRTGKMLACGNEKALAAWSQVDVEKKRTEAERLRADKEKQLAEAEKARAEAEKRRADLADGQILTERQRAEAEKLRADRLAEKLRELGVDPG